MGLSNRLSYEAGSSPAATTPTGFFSQGFWGFISLCWNPGLCSLSRSPVVPPSLSACQCGTVRSTSCRLTTIPLRSGCPSPPLLPIWVNVSFLTPWLSDFPISRQYWLFFVFKFVVALLLVVQEGTVCLPMPPSWLEVYKDWIFMNNPRRWQVMYSQKPP